VAYLAIAASAEIGGDDAAELLRGIDYGTLAFANPTKRNFWLRAADGALSRFSASHVSLNRAPLFDNGYPSVDRPALAQGTRPVDR